MSSFPAGPCRAARTKVPGCDSKAAELAQDALLAGVSSLVGHAGSPHCASRLLGGLGDDGPRPLTLQLWHQHHNNSGCCWLRSNRACAAGYHICAGKAWAL